MSNLGPYKASEREGTAYERTKVDDRYVYEEMQRSGDHLGGKQSGHIIFVKYAMTGNGMVAVLKLTGVLMKTKAPLLRLAGEVVIYLQRLKNVAVRDKVAAEMNAVVLVAVRREEAALAGDGRALLRVSGTEPVTRVMVKASSEALCDETIERLVGVLAAEGLMLES